MGADAVLSKRYTARARRRARVPVGLALVAMLLGEAGAHAQAGPRPPCGGESIPAHPPLDAPAVATAWRLADLGRDWKPPVCTGWSTTGFLALVSTVARVRNPLEMDGLLGHIGAISELAGLRYWSTTRQRWQVFIEEASAVTSSEGGRRRADFTSDEMRAGAQLYFEQVDNLSGKGTYRMHIAEVSADRLVFDIENVSTLRYHWIPILHPGDSQSFYVLDREPEHVWRFHSLTRTGQHASRLLAGNDASAVNRAVAFYRHIAGVVDVQEPPAAR